MVVNLIRLRGLSSGIITGYIGAIGRGADGLGR